MLNILEQERKICKYSRKPRNILKFILLSCITYTRPLLAPFYIQLSGVSENELKLSLKYFNIVNFFSLIVLFNTVFASYFTGIQRTNIVMYTNVSAMIFNIPISYYLIQNGLFGFFEGIEGAALGTSLSNLLMFGIYCGFYFSSKNVEKYMDLNSYKINTKICKKIAQFGIPTGLEFFLLFFAFNSL